MFNSQSRSHSKPLKSFTSSLSTPDRQLTHPVNKAECTAHTAYKCMRAAQETFIPTTKYLIKHALELKVDNPYKYIFRTSHREHLLIEDGALTLITPLLWDIRDNPCPVGSLGLNMNDPIIEKIWHYCRYVYFLYYIWYFSFK